MPDQPSHPPVAEKIKQEINKIPPTTDRNLMAALSYVWFISLIMLIIRRDEPFIQHHAKQGLVLALLSLLGFIPVAGWIIAFLAVIGMIIGFIYAWQGKEYQIPFVYGWSQKIHF